MRHDAGPLLEAIRCELLGVQSRLEAQERRSLEAARGRTAASETASAVPMVAGAADMPATQGSGGPRRERELRVPIVAEAAPVRRLRR